MALDENLATTLQEEKNNLKMFLVAMLLDPRKQPKKDFVEEITQIIVSLDVAICVGALETKQFFTISALYHPDNLRKNELAKRYIDFLIEKKLMNRDEIEMSLITGAFKIINNLMLAKNPMQNNVADDNVADDNVADDNVADDNVADDNVADDNVADDVMEVPFETIKQYLSKSKKNMNDIIVQAVKDGASVEYVGNDVKIDSFVIIAELKKAKTMDDINNATIKAISTNTKADVSTDYALRAMNIFKEAEKEANKAAAYLTKNNHKNLDPADKNVLAVLKNEIMTILNVFNVIATLASKGANNVTESAKNIFSEIRIAKNKIEAEQVKQQQQKADSKPEDQQNVLENPKQSRSTKKAKL